jgi:hypothetical protein
MQEMMIVAFHIFPFFILDQRMPRYSRSPFLFKKFLALQALQTLGTLAHFILGTLGTSGTLGTFFPASPY